MAQLVTGSSRAWRSLLAAVSAVLATLIAPVAAAPAAPTFLPSTDIAGPYPFPGIANGPVAAMDPQGDSVIAVEVNSGTGHTIEAMVRPAGGSFGPPVPLSGAANGAFPTVAVDSRGDAFVVWQQDPDGTYKHQVIQYSMRAPGGTFTSARGISTPSTTTNAGMPSAIVDAQGNLTVAWTLDDGMHHLAQIATLPAGATTFSDPTTISPPLDQDSSSPRLAFAPNEDALAVWEHPTGVGSEQIIQG